VRRGNFYFFDIPVYRLAEDEYYRARAAFADEVMTRNPLPTTPPKPSEALTLSQQDAAFLAHLCDSYGGSWQYNEIIGYLRLHLLGTQIRAEYWRVAAKRIVRTRRKLIEFRHWKAVPEDELPLEGTNAEIYQAVLNHVAQCKHELKPLHVDSNMLEAVGPYIDWRALFRGP
jgi:hypothetical protein